jgi:hypothetical protein
VTFAVAAATRHLGLHPLPGLLAGTIAGAGSALLLAWQAPAFALGEYGMRMRDIFLSHLTQLRPFRQRKPA